MIYQVYVGKPSRLYDHCTASVAMYCQEHGIDHIVQTTPILKIKPDVFATNRSKESYEKHGGFLPIYEKENALDYFDRYDQICIVDADIFIRSSSPNIFDELDPEVSFAGVLERDMPVQDWYKQKLISYSNMQYRSLQSNQVDFKPNKLGYEFYNMGLMLMNKSITKYMKTQSARSFIERMDFKDFVDGIGAWKWSTDQTLLNYWLRKDGVPRQDLSWRWNALYTAVHSEYIKDASFVHFFLKDKLPNRGENVEELMKAIE